MPVHNLHDLETKCERDYSWHAAYGSTAVISHWPK